MYVRISRVKKKNGTYEYYQLVESKRVGTTISKKVICSFGSTSAPTLPTSLLEFFLSKTSAKLYAFPTAIYQLCVRDLEQKTGKTIKTIREEYATSVAIPGKKQPLILGNSELLQAIQ